MKQGAALALEDYAAADEGLSEYAKTTLETEVSVPDGALPTHAEWKETLAAAGFKDIEIQDRTQDWANFVSERLAGANADAENFDALVGPGKRHFFATGGRYGRIWNIDY